MDGDHNKVPMDELESNGLNYFHDLLSVTTSLSFEEVTALEDICTLEIEIGVYMLKANTIVVIFDGREHLACLQALYKTFADVKFNWTGERFRIMIIRSLRTDSKHFSS